LTHFDHGRSRGALILALLAALMLALAGCGGGGDDDKGDAGKKGAKGAPTAGALEEYVPQGELVADSGFRPDADGFSFPNYGGEPDRLDLTPPNVQTLFGDQVCLPGSEDDCVLTPAAQQWAENQNAAMAQGHCEGMSITALRIWNEELNSKDFGAASPFDLEIDDNPDLQSAIAENYVYQALPPILAKRVKGKPSAVLQTLVDALESGEEQYTVGIYQPDMSAGHAITPYAVEDKGDGVYAILVWDNNFPGITRAIEVDTNAETWTYEGSPNPDAPNAVYRGDASTQTLELDPETPLAEEYSPCPFCSPEGASETDTAKGGKGSVLPKGERFVEITLNGTPGNSPHLVFADDAGRKTGIVGGKLLQQLPDVEVVRTFSAQDSRAPEPRYRMPEGSDYVISIDGSDLKKPTKPTMNILVNGLSLEVSDIAIAPGQVDEMYLPEGLGLTYQSNSEEEQAPTIVAGLGEGDVGYVFGATAVGIKKGSVISVVVLQDDKVMFVDSTGSEGSAGKGRFITNLTRVDAKGKIDQWQADDVALDGTKEEKIGFVYSDAPARGKPMDFVVLDKQSELLRSVVGKPQ
jgi:hypothetical protein